MTEHDDGKIREALKRAFCPVDATLRRDLWPMVLGKFEERSASVPWYDWALIAATILAVLAFPHLLLVFAYHL
jgi:hypothetical protein